MQDIATSPFLTMRNPIKQTFLSYIERLVFKLFNGFDVSLWAPILWCSEFFFFLEKCLDSIFNDCFS